MAIYLKYGAIKGNVKAGPYATWMELTNAQLGQTSGGTGHPGYGVGRESNALTLQDIVVTRFQDSVSPLLYQEAISGKGVEALIDMLGSVKPGEPPVRYLRLTLGLCMISGFTISSGGDRPMESLSLNFSSVKSDTNLR